MVKACSAPGCRYQYRKGDGIKMHSFPKVDTLKTQWLKAMDKQNCSNFPSKTSVICSQHFELGCYEVFNGKTSLRKEAVPNIFYDSKSIRPVIFKEHTCSIELVEETTKDSVEAKLEELFQEKDSQDENKCTDNVLEENESIVFEIAPEKDLAQSGVCEIVIPDLDKVDCEFEEYIQIDQDDLKQCTRGRKQPHFIGDFRYEDLESPVQRRKYWLMTHKVNDTQKKKLKYYSGKLRALQMRVERLSQEVRDLKKHGVGYGMQDEKGSKKLIFIPKSR